MAPKKLESPVGSATDYTGPFEKFATTIEDNFQKACDKFEEIVDKLNSWKMRIALAAAGPALGWFIKSQLEKLLEGLRRLKKLVDELLKHHMPIISLMNQSFAWTHKIKGPVSNLSADCTTPHSDNMYYWTGAASEAYKDKAAKMGGAVDEVSDRSEFMSAWLFTVTKTNVEYVKQLAEIVTSLIGKIVDAAAKAKSVIGLPLLGQTIGDAAGELTEKGLNALLQLGVNLVSALGDVRDVDGVLENNKNLPNGAWPNVVAEH